MGTVAGEIQIVSTRTGEYGEYGYGFDLKDTISDQSITLVTQTEAEAARRIIEQALTGVIDAFVSGKGS